MTAPAATHPAPDTAPARPADGTTTAGTRFDADVLAAVRNASKLTLSLIGTLSIAMVVRIMLPRHLGPALYGSFQFADAFTSGMFVLASLGVETYVWKEVATRREHASEFYGGLLVLRVAMSCVLVAAALLILAGHGKPPLVLRLVAILGVSQFFVIQNATYAALLQAVGEVNGLSILNIVSKLVWGAGIAVGLALGGGVLSVAVAMLASEVFRLFCLGFLARRHLSLRIRFDLRVTLAVLTASLPFFVAGLSQTLYAKVNLTVLGFIAGDTEVGWYGAASSIAGTAMLLAPVIWWVLLPLSARADARSPKELTMLTRRAMEMVLVIVTPISLMLGLGADVVVPTLLGPAYAPAVLSLRAMAPVFLLTYLGMVSGGTLIGSGRGWLVTAVLVSGVITSPILNYLFVPRSLAIFGPGGAGVGAAAALNVTEGYITVLLTLALGNRAFDRRSLTIFGKTVVVCLGVIAMDRLLLRPYGALRLAVDVVVYSALVLSWGAADHRALIRLATRALSRPATAHADAA